ncbi:LCP family protein [Alkaliphilus serpentinus]|uniref:LytR family transcriptional regulator n=1 Tax=Alkaliphilus serpentinus TaxID=1482731 RepID=A0A833HRD2_9FIRM|nr:LCP family protein [Alkaliphilus serpentinus]KAB3533116.1 LytR family transcriptional regulator [Alkaliphilus serpentinus]
MFIKKKKIILILLVVVSFLAIASYFNIVASSGFGEKKHILIFGVDSSEGKTNSRSDTIMLFSYGGGMKPMLISIPRDARVQIPGRQNLDKINHAHAYGGSELLVESVENLFKIKIDHYIGVNYKAVEEMVDALGGIEVEVPMDMKYSDPYADPPLHIDLKKGLQVLDGKSALHFLRFRKGYTNQDLGRIHAQQDFAKAVIEKVSTPSIIFKAPKLIGTFYSNINTDLSKMEMVGLGFKVMGMKVDDINRLTLAGSNKYINGISYFIINEEALSELQKEISSGKTLGKVEVLNGNGGVGIATKYAEILENKDIVVGTIGNHSNMNIEKSFIEYRSSYKKEAKRIAKILSISNLILLEDEKTEADIRVIIGKDLE